MKCRKCHKELPENSKFCLHCGAAQNVTRAPKSRGNGQGSVFKRGNTWMAMVTVGYEVKKSVDDEPQKVRRVTRSKSGFKTKKTL